MGKKKIEFEAAMNRIDEIISTLESNKISLDQSIKCYKEAMELVGQGHQILDSIEGEIKKITIVNNKPTMEVLNLEKE